MKITFTLLLIIIHITISFGQSTIFSCGELQHHTAKKSHEHQNHRHPLYVDRFDNFQEAHNLRPSPNEKVNKSLQANCSTSNNMFNIFFLDQSGFGFDDGTVGADRRNIVCQVFEDISRMIQVQNSNSLCYSSVNIKVDVSSNLPLSPQHNILASGSAYYRYDSNSSGIVHGEVWKVINSGESHLVGNAFYHGYMQFNFHNSINWNTDFNNVSPQSPDLYATVLHEAFHILGFASAIDDMTGAGKNGYYYPWDKLIKDSQGADMISGTCYNQVYTGLQLNSGCSSFFVNDGFTDHVVHTPATFVDGRSLSHLDNCSGSSPNYLMHPFQTIGSPIRIPTREEVLLLCELGYKTTGMYGDGSLSFHKTYDIDWDCGHVIAGVPDGINPLINNTCMQAINIQCDPTEIFISDLIANDLGAADITCRQIINGTGSISNINPTSFTFTPDQAGTVILNYIPINASGKEGNITEVYLTVNFCPGASYNCVNTDPCNIICNSDLNDDIVACNYNNVNACGPTLTYGGLESNCSGFAGWIAAPTIANSPDFIDPCSHSIVIEQHPPLLDNNSGYFHMWPNPLIGFYPTETVAAPVNVLANERYLLSFDRAAWFNNFFTEPLELFRAELADGVDMINQYKITNSEIIYSETNIVTSWERIVVCFTPTVDKEFLIFHGYNDDPDGSHAYLDNVELIHDSFSAGPDATINCGDQVTLGTTQCSISGTDYQWYIIDQGIPIIITGQTSETITVTPQITSTYIVERTIAGDHGNCLTSEDEVTVTVNNPLDAHFLLNVSNCSSDIQVQGSANLDDLHKWDFNNDGVFELTGFVSDNGHIANFGYSMSGTYTIYHEVHSACGTSSSTQLVTVSIPSNSTSWPVVLWPSDAVDVQVRDMIVDQHEHVIVTGKIQNGKLSVNSIDEFSSGKGDFFIAKLDDCGQLLWFRRSTSISTNSYSIGHSVAIDAQNNIYIVGEIEGSLEYDINANTGTVVSANSTASDGILLAYSPSGDYLWHSQVSSTGEDGLTAIQTDPLTGDIYALGHIMFNSPSHLISSADGTQAAVNPTPSIGTNRILLRFDPSGIHQWHTIDLLNRENLYNYAPVMEWDKNGMLLIGGDHIGTMVYEAPQTPYLPNSAGLDLIKYNPAIQQIDASKQLYNVGYVGISSLAVNSTNEIYVAGYTDTTIDLGNSIVVGGQGQFIAKFSSDFSNTLHGTVFLDDQIPVYRNVHTDSDDNIYLAISFDQGADKNAAVFKMTDAQLAIYDDSDAISLLYSSVLYDAANPDPMSGGLYTAITRSSTTGHLYSAGKLFNSALFSETGNSSISSLNTTDIFISRMYDYSNSQRRICLDDGIVSSSPISAGDYQYGKTLVSQGTVNGSTVNFKAGDSILLEAGFSVSGSAVFGAFIEGCGVE